MIGKALCFGCIVLMLSAISLAETKGDLSFKGKLKPEKGSVQREITPALAPSGEYDDYRYIGTYENSSGASFDLYFYKRVECSGEISVSGKLVEHSFSNCKHRGQAKCEYSATQIFVKDAQCISSLK